MMTETKDGPYIITCGIELIGDVPHTYTYTHRERASTEHYTVCRCGSSKNKPFCDAHIDTTISRMKKLNVRSRIKKILFHTSINE
jgi:CDGSH-type Zn-finger protein